MRFQYVVLLSVLLFMTGCLQTRESAKEQEEKQVLQKTVKNLQQGTADSSTRFQEIDEESRKMNGRLEIAENRVAQLMQRADKVEQNTENRHKETTDRMAVYQEAITRLEGQVAALNQQLVALQESAKTVAAVSSKKDPKAHFTVAEELFEKKKWKEAILEYDKYRKAAPSGKNYPAASYKMAVCFQELGMLDEAKVFYDEVVAKHPKSNEAKKAGIRLKSLKK